MKSNVTDTLNNLPLNHQRIVKRLASGNVSAKLTDMGIYPGKKVSVVFRAPFGGPLAIDMDGYTLSLRRDEASLVELES